MTLHWVYYLCLAACIVDAGCYMLSYWRTGERFFLLGIPALMCMAGGFALVQISTAETALIPREDLLFPIRAFLLAGSLLWLIVQSIYIYRFTSIHRSG